MLNVRNVFSHDNTTTMAGDGARGNFAFLDKIIAFLEFVISNISWPKIVLIFEKINRIYRIYERYLELIEKKKSTIGKITTS